MDLKTAYEIADEFGAWLLEDDAFANWRGEKVATPLIDLECFKATYKTVDMEQEFFWFMLESPRIKDFPADIETIRLIIRIFEACADDLEKSQATWQKTLARLEAEGKLAYKRKENDNEN